jgi:predicted double-glycine peptidase
MARNVPGFAVAVLAFFVGNGTVALDRLPKVHASKAVSAHFRDVPVGAIKIPLRDVQQDDDSSCGAAALMSICFYYEVGPKTLASFKRKVHTDPDEGTYYLNIRNYARKLGLRADVETEMSIDELKAYIDQGIPVICSIQAWGDPGADYTKNGNGHYVVAIGYDTTKNLYFMDPSANYEDVVANPRYGYLPEQEFIKRWHEDEGMGGKSEAYTRLGIVIRPRPMKATPLLRAREIE